MRNAICDCCGKLCQCSPAMPASAHAAVYCFTCLRAKNQVMAASDYVLFDGSRDVDHNPHTGGTP